MLDIAKDIQSLTAFRRRSGDFMKQLKRSKRPLVLTVKGKAAAVVQDAEAYQRLLDSAAGSDAPEGIRQAGDAKKGRMRPVRKFFDDFEPGLAYLVTSPPAPSATSPACTRRSTPGIPARP